jgi:hypothetical protein
MEARRPGVAPSGRGSGVRALRGSGASAPPSDQAAARAAPDVAALGARAAGPESGKAGAHGGVWRPFRHGPRRGGGKKKTGDHWGSPVFVVSDQPVESVLMIWRPPIRVWRAAWGRWGPYRRRARGALDADGRRRKKPVPTMGPVYEKPGR